MAETNRIELLSTIAKRDVERLSEITEKLYTEKVLADTVVAFNKRERAELWDGVLGMCMATLLESSNQEAEGSQTLAEMHGILLCITRLASATLSVLKQAEGGRSREDGRDAEIEVPPSLQETAIILHGILPTLESERNGLKNAVSALFESWWTQQLPCREELMANTLLYLLDRSTRQDAAKVDVTRIMAVHEVLSGVDLARESATPLVTLLLQCSYHPHYVTTTQGMQFLSFLFTLSPELAQRLHNSIKNHLPSFPVSWGSKYGEIYFRAWHKSSGEQREYLELNCIQDIMHNVCRMRMGARGSLWYALFKILNCLHGKKTQRGVEDMLTRLYEPILWRSLMVCNSDVRLSAAHLMFSAFPLQNSALHSEEADKALQRQFDAMHNLLQDPVPAVRLAAVEGVGRVLSIYWELIPMEVIKCFMSSLVEDLAYDITSPAIREAVIKVMQKLCDNHLALPLLTHVLPTLHNFVHDTSERVRTAMLDLLLKLKGLRAIKFYNVVAVEHLLARLEVETSESVMRRVMKLLFRSFVPVQETPQQQLERCKALILSNQSASRQFYLRLPKFLDVDDTVKYMVVLCRYLIESARQLNSDKGSSNQQHDADESSNSITETPVVEKRRRSGKSSAKQRRNSQGSPSQSHDGSNDDDDDENTNPARQQQQQQQMMAVLRGITEAIYLMYITLCPMLASSPEYRPMSEGLAKKLSLTVREMMAVSQNPDLDNTLISLAGHLPSKTLPLASQSLINRLRKFKPGQENSIDLTDTVKALVQWGKSNLLVEMLKESFEKTLIKEGKDNGSNEVSGEKKEEEGSSQVKNGKKEKPKKKTVGFSGPAAEEDDCLPCNTALLVLEIMLSQAECRPILRARHGPALLSLVQSLKPVLTILRDALAPASRDKDAFSLPDNYPTSMSMSVKLYSIHLRLSAFLSCLAERKPGREQEEQVAPTGNVATNHQAEEGMQGRSATISKEGHVCKEASRVLTTSLTWSSTCLVPWLKSAVQAGGDDRAVAGSHGNNARGRKQKSEDKRTPSPSALGWSQVLSQLLTFNLKLASNVMMTGFVGPALLDEAVQLCMAVLQPSESNGTSIEDPQVLTAALSCVYQLLSLRVIAEEGDSQAVATEVGEGHEAVSGKTSSLCKNKYAEIACSCICLLLKSPVVLTGTKGDGESVEGTHGRACEKLSDTNGSGQSKPNTELRTKATQSCPKNTGDDNQKAELLKAISSLVSEIILELTRPGQSRLASHKTLAALLECVLTDTARACEREDINLEAEEPQLPPLATTVMAAVKKRAATSKMFCAEVETYLFNEEDIAIYQAQAVLAVLVTLRSYNPSLLSPATYQALRTAVDRAARPSAMDEDVFTDLKAKAGEVVKKLRAEVISDSS